jgi:hypothetical protein
MLGTACSEDLDAGQICQGFWDSAKVCVDGYCRVLNGGC